MPDLSRDLADLARKLQSAEGLEATALSVAEAACRLIPGAEKASISLARKGIGIDTLASTDELPMAADEAQVATRQGPCISAAWEQYYALLRDTESDTRWPAYSARVKELGVRSMLSLQLSLEDPDERIGAINTYSTEPEAYTEESIHIGKILAVHASVALVAAARHGQFEEALASRDVIGQAKGILMARHSLSADEAFSALVQQSRNSNVRLRDLAERVVRDADQR
ncbi:GAF and ANTAR domain-containing protein [Ornithinicoccus halotolerans]|uniref:GAF and ANTAR domain-containing protein n=1 Tax=Ornithinicoccus halotolerans TaxID=1748220 RepID=UPI00129611EB|nr:GAF and ANTAR domain-containing protein [Ornithinicoccus halotolerans]